MAKHKNDEIWQQVKKLRRYGFWIIIIVLTVLTIRDVIDLVIEYNDDPKQSEMNIIFNESMSMPNITFCMSKKQAWSHFKIDPNETSEAWDEVIQTELANMTDAESFLKAKWDYRMVMEAYEVIATLNSLERETTPHGAARAMTVFRINPRLAGKRKLIKTWLNIIEERNVTFTQFTQKAGFEAIRRSLQRFARTSYDEDQVFKTNLQISWISMMNLCFQPMFDEDNFKDINDQGQFFILQTSHSGNANDSFDCMSVDFHGRPSALGRFMEGKGRVKDGVTDELCLGMVHEVNVEVRATYIMLENDDVGTACNEIEDDEDSEFDCRSRCRMNMIKEMCNCVAPTLQYLRGDDEEDLPICDYEKCTIDVQRGNFSDEECSKKCLRDCKQIRYQISLDQKGRSVRPDLTTVVLNWGSFEYLSLEQQYVWSVATFIAALGGSIGMWLGLSILSLIQGASWIMEKFGNKFCIKSPENRENPDAPNMTKMNAFDVKRNKVEPA
uniref:Amiloride-sensitive sodium channel n=1 Tax=Panagrellus redivivus TaxID=6233 RepID=A0A7E4W5G7_PANRE